MQNLITAQQMRDADHHTIVSEPIASINLMERASKAFVKAFRKERVEEVSRISILCGQGNNGGDGLAIARLLSEKGFTNIAVYLINFSSKTSNDYLENLNRLTLTKIPMIVVDEPNQLKDLRTDIIIDAILGSGLNKPLTGKYELLANVINDLNRKVVAVDVPTGFSADGPIATAYTVLKSNLTISFQRPKINFFFPESVKALSKFEVVDIGLDNQFIESLPSSWKLITKASIVKMIKARPNFSHKGIFGHALVVAGNERSMGAALLTASATLHTGAGLTTVCLPESGLGALNTSLPEVMALPRNADLKLEALEKYKVIGIGPGLGVDEENEKLFGQLIGLKKPMVIDADGLTMLSKNSVLLSKLPVETILTPHMKEFDRLFGEHKNWWERVITAQREAEARQLVILLKNQYTFICLPTGEICINPTGNPAMASGGMGDVLTGILTSLLAQGYSSADATILGSYLHGKTGDDLAKKRFVVTAGEVAKKISQTIRSLIKNK